jgi:hypothetical protein
MERHTPTQGETIMAMGLEAWTGRVITHLLKNDGMWPNDLPEEDSDVYQREHHRGSTPKEAAERIFAQLNGQA